MVNRHQGRWAGRKRRLSLWSTGRKDHSPSGETKFKLQMAQSITGPIARMRWNNSWRYCWRVEWGTSFYSAFPILRAASPLVLRPLPSSCLRPLQSESKRPCQTLATFQRNILQHRWAQHVEYVWPPCCDMLQHVGWIDKSFIKKKHLAVRRLNYVYNIQVMVKMVLKNYNNQNVQI